MGAEQSNIKSTKEKKPMKKTESVAKKPMKKIESVAKKPMKKTESVAKKPIKKKGGFRLNSTVPPFVKHTFNFWKEYVKLWYNDYNYTRAKEIIIEKNPNIDSNKLDKITYNEYISLVDADINNSIESINGWGIGNEAHSEETWRDYFDWIYQNPDKRKFFAYRNILAPSLAAHNQSKEKMLISEFRRRMNRKNLPNSNNTNLSNIGDPVPSSVTVNSYPMITFPNNGRHTKAYWEKYYQIINSSSRDRLASLNIHSEILQSNPVIDYSGEKMTSSNFLKKNKHENMPYSALSAMFD
jgi:hypothetical protein